MLLYWNWIFVAWYFREFAEVAKFAKYRAHKISGFTVYYTMRLCSLNYYCFCSTLCMHGSKINDDVALFYFCLSWQKFDRTPEVTIMATCQNYFILKFRTVLLKISAGQRHQWHNQRATQPLIHWQSTVFHTSQNNQNKTTIKIKLLLELC